MAALIQSTDTVATSVSSVAKAYPSNNTAGSTLMVFNTASSGSPTISDSQGNTWVGAPTGDFWYALNAKAGANTVTINFGTTVSFCTLLIWEFTQASAGGGLDQSNTGTATSSTINLPSLTPTVNGELLFAIASCDVNTPTVAGSYTTAMSPVTSGWYSEYQVQTTAAAVTPNFTVTSDHWTCFFFTFKPGTVTVRRSLMLLGVGS